MPKSRIFGRKKGAYTENELRIISKMTLYKLFEGRCPLQKLKSPFPRRVNSETSESLLGDSDISRADSHLSGDSDISRADSQLSGDSRVSRTG